MTAFHSIAQYAHNDSGHFFHYHSSVQKALQGHLAHFSAYIPLNSEISALPTGWKKWFHPFYNKKGRKKFLKDCIKLFKQPSRENRIFFLEFFGRKDFRIFSWAALLFAKKTDTLWILYRDDLSTRRQKDQRYIRFYSLLLKLKFKNRFTPLTDSELLADYYKKWFKRDLAVLPIPHTEYRPFPPFFKKEALILSWPGHPRKEKGELDIKRLVQIPDSKATSIELDVSGATLLPPIKNGLQLHLRKALLTQEEYFSSLHRADVILLPYDPTMYQWRTSGPFVEAILAGKLPLVKEGSWLAHELKRFDLPELIVDWENPLFFTHLFEITHNETVYQKLKNMQTAYAAIHSEKQFGEKLKNLLPSPC